MFCDADGKPLYMTGACTDITERKRTQVALQEARLELARGSRLTTMGELAASIAHEINQPLAAVVTNGNACLHWLANDTPDLEEAREAVMRIVWDGNRASDVIGRVRALLRKGTVEQIQLDLNDAIQEILALTRSELQRRRIQVRTELLPGLPRVLGDRVQLQQVILNLIMNGTEAMATITDRSRVLLIRSRVDDADVLVTVEDSGTGLDPGAVDRIFEAFFTTKPGGMGMGLSICRSIIESHGGRLSASPGSPHGAVFQFTVPIAARRASVESAA